MITAILLLIIALLVALFLRVATLFNHSKKVIQRQHLQIIADAEFRGRLMKAIDKGNTINRFRYMENLKASGIKI